MWFTPNSGLFRPRASPFATLTPYLNVLARGYLWEDAAILGVQIRLAGDDVAQNGRAVLNNGRRRFIT
jgi:hypothetical protein